MIYDLISYIIQNIFKIARKRGQKLAKTAILMKIDKIIEKKRNLMISLGHIDQK